MNIPFLLLDITILFISSYVITWFFAVYMHLNPLELFMIFAGLNFFNSVLQTYLIPFRYVNEARKELSSVQIFGFAIFGLLTGVTNLGILAYRFGLPVALLIGAGGFFVGPIVYAALWAALKEKVEYTDGSKSDKKIST